MTKKKLTLKELIDKKDKFAGAKKETKEIYVEKLDATVTIERPERSLIIESIEMGNDGGDNFLVYNCIVEPDLKDTELQKAYGCVEPTDIVDKIFDLGSVKGIAEQALSMAGADSKVSVVDDIKK